MVKVTTACHYNVMDRKRLQAENIVTNHHVIQGVGAFTMQLCTITHWVRRNRQSGVPPLEQDVLLLKHTILRIMEP
jgi:hypothetical protein